MKKSSQTGSVLVLVLILTSVLLVIAGSGLSILSAEYTHSIRSTTWNESLFVAEGGVDMAWNALNRQAGNTNAWTGWTPATTAATNHSITTSLTAIGTDTASVGSFTVSAYKVTNDWVIVSTGTCYAPNSSLTNIDRQVEVRVTPSTPFAFGLLAKEDINFNGNNVIVDSYNSTDTSTFPNGQYVVLSTTPTEHANQNGDVGTNGTQINAGNSNVYGDLNVGVDGEILTGPNVYVSGSQDDGLQVDIPDATGPGLTTTSSSAWTPSGATVSTTTGWSTANGSQISIGNNYSLGAGDHNISSIGLTGTKTLTIDARTGNVRLYVSGNISIGGNAKVNILTSTTPYTVTIWVVGSVDVGGNGVVSPTNNIPGQLKIFGKTPASGTPPTIKLHGNADFKGAVYAPGHDFTIGGGGVTGVVYGSVVAKTITLGGGAEFHYDEALGNVYNSGAGWTIVYWRENSPP
jgi:hypothetical protein